MNIVPALQAVVLKAPWPTPVRNFLVHAAGPFTIFFWAPTFKWMITISNIGDMQRPAELVSTNQQMAITLTGLLWMRYATQITPVNYNLAIVNMFMCMTGAYQLYRKSQLPEEKGGFWGKKK